MIRLYKLLQRASNVQKIKRGNKADTGKVLTGCLLWNVIEHISRAVDAFNVLFL